MFTKIFSLLIGLSISMCSFSQQSDASKVVELKHDFIIKSLELSDAEAEKFMPIYSEFEAKIKELRKQSRIEKKHNNAADQSVDQLFEIKQDILNLQKEYYTKFRTVLPENKLIQLQNAEAEFRKMLRKKIADK